MTKFTNEDWKAATDDPFAEPTPEESRGVLTAEQKAFDRERLRRAIEASEKTIPFPVAPRSRLRMALAAGLAAAALAGLLLQQREIGRLTRERNEPMALGARQVVLPTGHRRGPGGDTPTALSPDGPRLLLALAIVDTTADPHYRVDLIDLGVSPARTLWSAPIERQADNTCTLAVPRDLLAHGVYRIDLYGAGPGTPELLESYTVSVPPS